MSKSRNLADFISDSTIDATEIADSAVTTTKIADDAVTAGKLAVADNGTSGLALLSDGDGTFSWGASGAPISRYTSEKTFPTNGGWHTIAYLEADDANGPVGNTFRFRMCGYRNTNSWGGVEHTGVLIDQNSLVNTTTAENLTTDTMGYGVTRTFGDFGLGDVIRGVRVRVNQGNWYALQVKAYATATISEFEFEDTSNVGWVIVDPVDESTNPASLNDWPGTDGNTVGQAYYNNIFGYQSILDGANVPMPGTYVPGYLATSIIQTTTNGSSLYGTTFNGDASFGDNDKAQFGESDDLQIYHDGSDSYISDVGTGNLNIQSNGTAVVIEGTSGANNIIAYADGATNLYYNGGSPKLATTSSGVSITGDLSVSGSIAGAGKVLQMVKGDYTTLTSVSAQTWTNIVTLNVTPVASNSKFLLTGVINFGANDNENAGLRFVVNGGSLAATPSGNQRGVNAGMCSGGSNRMDSISAQIGYDSTLNAGTSYSFVLQFQGLYTNSWWINQTSANSNQADHPRGKCSFTVMEIAS